jgi:heptosyltransferase-2
MSTVIRSPNWIGDGIMSLPAIRFHKSRFPDEHLAVLAKSYLADIYLNIPEIDEIIPIPDHWSVHSYFSGLRQLRTKHFDRGILFTNSFSSALFFRLAGIARLAGYGRDGRGWLLHDRVPGPGHYAHHQYYYQRIVDHLAGEEAGRSFAATLVVSAAEMEWADDWLDGQGVPPGTPILAVSPAAAYGSAKAWPPERFREVIRGWAKIHPEATVLLLGAAGERKGIATLADGLPGNVFNLAGRLSLRRAIAVLSRCRMFIGNDSGMMHIAAALGIPLTALFGPTEPGRTAPLASRFRLLHHGADCAPCRRRRCPTDHRCMTVITVDEVLAAAAELWEEGMPEVE